MKGRQEVKPALKGRRDACKQRGRQAQVVVYNPRATGASGGTRPEHQEAIHQAY